MGSCSWRRAGESCGKMSTVVRPNYGSKGTDNITDLAELEGLLSPFQVEKLTYFFNQFFDFNMDGKIDAADFEGLNERLRKVAGWGGDDQEYINMVDNNRVVVDSVSLSSWLHMWARMCKGSAGIDDFPIWVQLIPRVIFNVICSKMRVDYITRESLRNFYENFSGLAGDNLEKVATEGYRSMSANGDYELDYKSYKLLFSNFLLGRTIYGPGKYIFGCFDNRDMNEPYKIVYDM